MRLKPLALAMLMLGGLINFAAAEVVEFTITTAAQPAFAGREFGAVGRYERLAGRARIALDPADPRKKGVLERWYKAVQPLLKNYYGTGGDLNVDEIHEVIPMTEANGLWHPQEGVINGHFKAHENEKIQQIGQLRFGVSKVLEDEKYSPSLEKKYVVADMIFVFIPFVKEVDPVTVPPLNGKK